MTKNTIIHLSDLHISESSISDIIELRKALIKDINNNLEGEISLIICSGDLVQAGNENNYKIAAENFINPLLESLNLDTNQFIYVPGNHEVDIKKIDNDFSTYFTNRILETGLQDDDLKKDNVLNRLKGFFDFTKNFNYWDQANLVNTIIGTYNNIKYGISCINTAWNSVGNSSYEAKKIIVPRSLLAKSIMEIENCDRKILVMHHPVDWFYDENAAEIEALLSKFDLVLTGHKHNALSQTFLHINNMTVFNEAPKLEMDAKNGYSLIIDNNENTDIIIKGRTYVKNRMTYAPNIELSDNGVLLIENRHMNNDSQSIADIILWTKKNFLNNLKGLFITNLLDPSNSKSFDELFVMPVLNKHSEIIKEKTDDPDDNETIDLFKEIDNTQFLNIWGRKELGKTILANYIAKYYYENYIKTKYVPVVIDCRFLPTYKSAIFNSINNRLNELSDNDHSINKKIIMELAQNGNFLIIFDNFENNNKQSIQLEEFLKSYPKNKFIFLRNETPAVFSDEDKEAYKASLTNDLGHSNIYIRNMDKHNIRLLAQNMHQLNPLIEDTYVNKVVYSFSSNNLPRTPFAVSLILAICSENSDYMPTNQAKIVETFMEKILEKLNPEEKFSKTYDFNNKEKFLSAFAYAIHLSPNYYLIKSDFDDFVKEYHDKKAYDIKDSKFDTIFFEKGILVEYDNKVFFRYECLVNYYLAKYCLSNNNYYYDKILTESNYLNYTDMISYYSGLNREDEKTLLTLVNYANKYIETEKDVNLLETDSIKLQFDIPDDEIKKHIASTEQLSSEEKDKLSDLPDQSIHYNPIIQKKDINHSKINDFSMLIELLGIVIRNSEELDANLKEESFSLYIKGCKILWKFFREGLLSFAKEFNKEILLDKYINEGNDINEIKELLKKSYDTFCDIIKLSVPLAISAVIYDSIGTEKLKKIILDAYTAASPDSADKLLLLLLICDLKIYDWHKYLNNYIKITKKNDFLWIIFFKCQYYYQFNYFNNDTPKIIEPMADCFIAANKTNKLNKSNLIREIKQQKKLNPSDYNN